MVIIHSCTERIEVELDDSQVRLAVYGEISDYRKSHSVRLTKTSGYFSNTPPEGISGALVTISDGTKEIILEETDSGMYVTNPNFAGIPGLTYTLRIENVDIDNDGREETYEASSYLPRAAPIDSIKLSYMSNLLISGWQILLYSTDPPDSKDFYVYKVYKNSILQTDSLSEYIFRSDAFFNGKSTNGMVSQFLFDNKPNEKIQEGDLITFELNGITEEYYNFLVAVQQEISLKIPVFSGPPANVKSNFSGGAVGFFTAYSVVRITVAVPNL